jgi:hypothetical protein
MSELLSRCPQDFMNFSGVNFEVEPEHDEVVEKPKSSHTRKLEKKAEQILQEFEDKEDLTHVTGKTLRLHLD